MGLYFLWLIISDGVVVGVGVGAAPGGGIIVVIGVVSVIVLFVRIGRRAS